MDDGAKEERGEGPDHWLYIVHTRGVGCVHKRVCKTHDRGEDRGEVDGEERKRGREREDRALTSA